ncbi:hypothetical protein ACFL3D_01825 [Candidatus Omnitrophota bacterium]
MSIWRAEIDLSFKTEDDLIAFLNLVETLNDKISPKQEGSLHIHRKVRYHECFHDVGGRCGDYKVFDFSADEKFKTKQGDKKEPEDVLTDEFKDKIKNKP